MKLDDEGALRLGHAPIYHGGKIVGQTSSCAFGYRAGKPIVMGHAHMSLEDGAGIQIDIARVVFDATVLHGSMFDLNGSRMKG